MLVKIKSNKNKFKFYDELNKDVTHEVVNKLGFRNLIITNVTGGLMTIEVLKEGYFETGIKKDQIKKLLKLQGFEVA